MYTRVKKGAVLASDMVHDMSQPQCSKQDTMNKASPAEANGDNVIVSKISSPAPR